MARPKKNTGVTLTPQEQDILFVANHVTSSDKISWQRKYNNLQTIIAQLTPLEEQIAELHSKRIPLYDEIAILRQVMVEECIHPADMLAHKGDHIECKFCMKHIIISPITTA
jgi:hypothetical protein